MNDSSMPMLPEQKINSEQSNGHPQEQSGWDIEKQPAVPMNNPKPVDSLAIEILREHIAFLKEQLAAKDRWNLTELERLRSEVKGQSKRRIAMAQLLMVVIQGVADGNLNLSKEDLAAWRKLTHED